MMAAVLLKEPLKALTKLVSASLINWALVHFKDLSVAAGCMLLDGRTFDRTVRAKHAAIPMLWFKQCSAALAFIEKQAGIGRHGFRFGMPAVWAGDRRFENYGIH